MDEMHRDPEDEMPPEHKTSAKLARAAARSSSVAWRRSRWRIELADVLVGDRIPMTLAPRDANSSVC